jgi:hypothetical protein
MEALKLVVVTGSNKGNYILNIFKELVLGLLRIWFKNNIK